MDTEHKIKKGAAEADLVDRGAPLRFFTRIGDSFVVVCLRFELSDEIPVLVLLEVVVDALMGDFFLERVAVCSLKFAQLELFFVVSTTDCFRSVPIDLLLRMGDC